MLWEWWGRAGQGRGTSLALQVAPVWPPEGTLEFLGDIWGIGTYSGSRAERGSTSPARES